MQARNQGLDRVALRIPGSGRSPSVSVDKAPASLDTRPDGRIFGFSPLTVLVPQALMGVAAVGLLYSSVKQISGSGRGPETPGGALALTTVASLMFRFNNPDAMLTLCLVLAAYLTTRAIEKAGWKWLAGCGAASSDWPSSPSAPAITFFYLYTNQSIY